MKTLIAIPCGDFCHTDFLRALLSLEVSGEIQYTFAQGSLIYDARNQLAEVAINGGFDRVLWLDSDMIFPPDTLKRLNKDLDEGREIVSGLYVSRKAPIRPVVYSALYVDKNAPHAKPVDEWGEELFRCAGFGFGTVLMETALLKRVRDAYGQPFTPAGGFGEDLSFCLRAKEAGAELWCDPGIPLNHLGIAVYSSEMLRRTGGEND